MLRRTGAAALVFAILLAACGSDDCDPPPPAPTPTPDPGAVTLIEAPDHLEFRTGAASVRIDRAAFRLTLRDAAGRVLAEQADRGLRFTCGGAECTTGRVITYFSDPERPQELTVGVDTDNGGITVLLAWYTPRSLLVTWNLPRNPAPAQASDAYRLQPGELIYGLTERLTDSRPLNDVPGLPPIDELIPREVGSLNRRGETVDMLVRATYGLYTPFYQSSSGYGLYVRDSTPGSYDIGSSDPDELRFRFDVGANGWLAYLLFAGPRHADIMDEYTRWTGRPFLPPEWAFKHWRYRGEHEVGAPVVVDGVAMNPQVAEDLLMYERHAIPPGVYMIDRPWSEGDFGFENFRWDPLRFPNLDDMLGVIRERGYRLAVWSAALAAGRAPGDNGREARQLGYLAPGVDQRPMAPEAQLLDLTNPAAREWWAQKHVEWIERYDIAGIKLDRGEEYVSVDPMETYWDGTNARQFHNLYPVANIQMYHDFMRAARGDGDFVVKARAGYAGAQHYGIFWGGDMPGATALGNGPGTDLGLRTAIIALQRAAFMGFPFWGSDTGGYYQFKQRDVFARWLQFSAFCPLMNIGGVGPHAPWDMPTEPRHDEEMIAIYRRYVQVHHDLVPYVMRYAEIASRTGLPITRPLVFDYPDDPNVRNRWDEYLYGDDLLVAPLWRNGARARDVYLPAGRWEDFWDPARVFEGPRSIAVDAPLDVIPVFVRAGADVPGRP